MKNQNQQQRKQQQQHQQLDNNQLLSKLQKLLFASILFGFGFAFGIITSFYVQATPLQSFFYLSKSLPPPLPLPPPPPLPAPVRINNVNLEDFLKPPAVVHNMTDKELFWLASTAPSVQPAPFNRKPKVAFMFLTRGLLAFTPLWEKFFKGHQGLYSIYVHADPSFNGTVAQDSVFFGRSVPSKVVEWGKLNMMDAERRLLANALLDFSNQRFVLLSESCVPLFNFPTIYSYLTDSEQTYIEIYDDLGPTGRRRYSKLMQPAVKLEQWRKGSQWFQIDRSLAIQIISDNKYYPVFARNCKRTCYIDEHYIPTLVTSTARFRRRNANRTLTWVDWSRGGCHPLKYDRVYVTVELLKRLRSGGKCTYNGKSSSMCYLFARKFAPNSLVRFLLFAPRIMGFG